MCQQAGVETAGLPAGPDWRQCPCLASAHDPTHGAEVAQRCLDRQARRALERVRTNGLDSMDVNRAVVQIIGLLLAIASQVGGLLLSTGSVQICTPVGVERGHFEVVALCDSFESSNASIRTERKAETASKIDACLHSLHLIDGRRNDHEPTPLPKLIVLPLLWADSGHECAEHLCCLLRDDPRLPVRLSERSASPLGLPRPPPTTYTA